MNHLRIFSTFRPSVNHLLTTLLFTLASACTPLISLYDADTFTKTSELKARALVLMDHGSEPYASYNRDADEVLVLAWSLYDRQKVRHQNQLSMQQWKLLMDDNVGGTAKSILPSFFERWKAEGSVGKAYIREKKEVVAKAFDEILELEGAKIKKGG